MSRWLAIIVLAFATGLTCLGQAPDSGTANSSNTKPATKDGSSAGNSSGTSNPSTAPGKSGTSTGESTRTPEKKKPKKVWTNDEIGSVKGGISVVGDEKAGNANRTTSRPSGDPEGAHAEMVQNYRDRIQPLRDQIDAADGRIAQLKSFKGENTSPSGGIDINHGYNMVPVEEQVKQLEEKKKKLQAKIEDIEVEAKKNGVDPGDLR